MTPLEEKVARTIYVAGYGEDGHAQYASACDECLRQARAAIAVVVEAMREPTPEMLLAASEASTARPDFKYRTSGNNYDVHLSPRNYWLVMHAEFERSALSPTTPEGRG